VDYGMGVVLNRTNNVYTLSLRQRAAMEVSVGDGYVLRSVSADGAIGTIKEMSSSFKNWYAHDNKTTSATFHNGTEETFIKSLTVNYCKPEACDTTK
jgi:hypothetical protein